jgi:hypothetical protein
VEGATLIAVTTVNNDHDAVATALAPLLRDGQIVCLIPGYVGGALQCRHQLDRLKCTARVKLGEMDNFPFTGAIEGASAVRVASPGSALGAGPAGRRGHSDRARAEPGRVGRARTGLLFREGRTLERMGLEGRSLDAILSAVTRTQGR